MSDGTRVHVLAVRYSPKRNRRAVVLCRTNRRGRAMPVLPGVYLVPKLARIEYAPREEDVHDDGAGQVFPYAKVTRLQTGVALDDLRGVEVVKA